MFQYLLHAHPHTVSLADLLSVPQVVAGQISRSFDAHNLRSASLEYNWYPTSTCDRARLTSAAAIVVFRVLLTGCG
ncbi:hypothetical protein B0H10DRAFT_2222461 [Mycena sp. CBHHK59/15]|nr:hypothetical protein B0H10DRAFT_2222461 [Mycena sp. CBHHK59/15]